MRRTGRMSNKHLILEGEITHTPAITLIAFIAVKLVNGAGVNTYSSAASFNVQYR